MNKLILFFSVMLLPLVGAACRQETQEQPSENTQINLTVEQTQQEVGQSVLIVHVLDGDGSPINDANLEVKGDMTHAGMVPVLTQMDGGGEAGRYKIPIEWTMGGDWIVTVMATLPDGRSAEKRFDLQVTMGGS